MSSRGPVEPVLVTGATTPLGVELCAALLAAGVPRVLAIGREQSPRAAPCTSERCIYLPVDLARTRETFELLFGPVRELGITTVVHLSMHRSIRARGPRAHAFNVESLRTLLELGERHPTLRRLVVRSFAEVYRVDQALPTVVTEDHPLDMHSGAPQWLRDRVEADVLACTRPSKAGLEVAVLRCAELLAPNVGSQLWDYLDASVCLVPWGYDPMLNVLSLGDAARALVLAASAAGVSGIFNIPGADTLPLRDCVRLFGKVPVPVPGFLLGPIYKLRRKVEHADFSYSLNASRFHFGCVLDGSRAKEAFGYMPRERVAWS